MKNLLFIAASCSFIAAGPSNPPLQPTMDLAAPPSAFEFELIGQPVVRRDLKLGFVTEISPGCFVAWGVAEGGDESAIVGVDVRNGTLERVDLRAYGRAHIQMIQAGNGKLYAYAGAPGRFLK